MKIEKIAQTIQTNKIDRQWQSLLEQRGSRKVKYHSILLMIAHLQNTITRSTKIYTEYFEKS